MAGTRKAKPRAVGVVVRPHAPQVERRAKEVARWLARRGIEVLVPSDWANPPAQARVVERTELVRVADLIIVLGGDGSLLGIARLSGPRAVPIFGLHHGDFGFLTESDAGKPYATLEKLLAGKCKLARRTMLAVTVRRAGRSVIRSQALNDAVVHQGRVSRMLSLDVSVNREHLAAYKGDGIVVSTPTGSTAYSLSAGGPVVSPDMSAIILTPISPHTLSIRPLVLPDSSYIRVRVEPGCEESVLTLDGQEWFELAGGDEVEVTKSRHHATIAKVEEQGFFETLRSKLHWGARGDRARRS
jgi:NAD+ kinase